MGKRHPRERQEGLWLATASVGPKAPDMPFYTKLETLLRTHRFDERVEHLCARFYKGRSGRPSGARAANGRSASHWPVSKYRQNQNAVRLVPVTTRLCRQ